MNDELEPYENTIPFDVLRREFRFELDQKYALINALRDAPEIPPVIVLRLIARAADYPSDHNKGKELQRKYGSEAIPYKHEYEGGAGLWFRIRQGLKSNG